MINKKLILIGLIVSVALLGFFFLSYSWSKCNDFGAMYNSAMFGIEEGCEFHCGLNKSNEETCVPSCIKEGIAKTHKNAEMISKSSARWCWMQ